MGKRVKSAGSWSAKRLIAFSVIVTIGFAPLVKAQDLRESQLPLVRGPGISQEQLEAVAEAQGRPTLSDQLDLLRPNAEMTSKLHRQVERAQNAWLSGSIESARVAFRDITRLTLEDDWRPAQREAIHYAYLRLAQSAPTPTERDEWLEKAVVSFPDLVGDEDTFPPPLNEAFRATRARMLALARMYAPYEHFPDHRFLLINGKRFALSPDLKLRLPGGTFRVTALSDAFSPMTEKLTSSQLEAFRLTMPPLASGSCDAPGGFEAASDGLRAIPQVTVVFSPECLRTHSTRGWLARGSDTAESARVPEEALKGSSSLTELSNEALSARNSQSLTLPERPASPAVSGKTWLWIGASVLAAGAIFAFQKEANREQPTKIEPVHRTGN
jgi:hypothetical protein